MKRRQLISTLGVGAAAATLAACGQSSDCQQSSGTSSNEVIHWKMVTTWPKNFPGLGEGANYLADLIKQLSGGRLQIKVYGAGEIVPALEVFDAVANGSVQMGHGAAYYWKSKLPDGQFFTSVPFGLTAQEMNAWLLKGGGLELWRELYQPFGLEPMPCGNTGVQMAGWFNKEINTVDDLKGLKMRIPGLGGAALQKAGGEPVLLPGGELFTALSTGRIDATEWVSPYNDMAFGLHKAAKYYYYPGWHEPGSSMECLISQKALQALPDDLQQIVRHACLIANQDMISDFTAKNNHALQVLRSEHNIELRRLPDDVLHTLRGYSEEIVADLAKQSPFAQKVFDSYQQFRSNVVAWHAISEQAFMQARA